MQYDDLHYEFQYIGKDCDDILEEDILEESFFNLRNKDKNFFVKPLSLGVIQSLTKDSPLHLLRALYACKPFAICNENNESFITQENAARILGYKSAFYLSFIAHKDSLSNEYLNARKALYKTIMNLREQREQDYKEEQERISQLSYEEYQREREKTLREQQRQERIQRARNPNTTNHLILETKDKNNVVIFLDSDISLSNLIHIHNNKIDIFTKDGTILDIQRLETLLQEYININHNTDNNTNNNDNNTAITLDLLNSPNTQIFLYSQLLLGGSESPISSQEYFFGLLDSKNSDTLLDTLKPIYYFAPKDESSGLGKLSIFYHSSTLTLLNYSIIDSSLNIKLECNSKESQKLLSNALSLKEKEYQSKTIQAQQSIATLHSLLENQEVKCIHGGKVILKSNKGKTFKSDGIPLILESDLLGSKISGCPRSVGGVSDPCTQVVNVKASLSQKKINGEYAILQELIGGCLTDKGFPLEVSFVPSKIKFDHSYDPKIGLTKQSLTTSQSFNLPILRLYYKEHNYQIDNTLIQRYTLNNTLYELKEESNPQFFKEVIFEEKDLMDLSKSIENTKDIAPYQDKIILFDSLKQEFQKYYEFKEVTLNLGIHTFFLIFVIPKRIPKIYQKDYKALDSQRKDYGIGYFKELLEYNKDYKETNTQNNPYTPFLLYHTRVFLAPAKAKKIHFEFALGLDNYIESKDKESNTNVCKFKVLSGDVIEEREEVEGGDDIPDNVIRIETEDGSGEYIEIEFDENDNLKDINNDDELNDLLHQAKDILYELSPLSSMESAYDNLTAGEYKDALIDTITILPMAKVFKAKTVANKIENIISKDKNKKDVRIAKPKPKSLSRQEVESIINKLQRGSTENTRLVNTKQELQELWQKLIKNATKIEERVIPITNKKTGQTTQETLIRYQLDDKTQIVYRTGSKSGGEAVNVYGKNPELNKTIHIKGAK